MHNQQLSVRLIRFKLLIKQLHYTNIEHINTIIIDITIIPMNPPHPSTFAYSLQDTVLAYSSDSSIARAFKAHSEQGVVFNPSSIAVYPQEITCISVYVNAVMEDIVCCINHIHI